MKYFEKIKGLHLGLAILIIIQGWFFFMVQLDSREARQEAVDFYFDSALYRIEFPAYHRFLKENMANNIYYSRLEKISSSNLSNIEMYWIILFDPFFQTELKKESLFKNTGYYLSWKKNHDKYVSLLKDDKLFEYMFNSMTPSVKSATISLFATNNYVQFIINLFFIIFLGVILEKKIGTGWFLGGYLLGGVIMISAYCLITPYSFVPVSANNGGIACLIGVITFFRPSKEVNQGWQLVFLPLWVFIQYVSCYFDFIDLFNAIPQIASLMGGGVIAYYLMISMRSNSRQKDTRI